MRLKPVTCIIPVVILFALASLVAQQSRAPAPQPGTRRGNVGGNQKGKRQHQEPCWKQVGIPQNVMEQRRSIQESTRSQVEQVCTESTLTEQQRREKIHEIRKSAHEQTMALLSPDQRERLKQCQLSREHGRGGAHPRGAHLGGHAGHEDPCAEFRR